MLVLIYISKTSYAVNISWYLQWHRLCDHRHLLSNHLKCSGLQNDVRRPWNGFGATIRDEHVRFYWSTIANLLKPSFAVRRQGDRPVAHTCMPDAVIDCLGWLRGLEKIKDPTLMDIHYVSQRIGNASFRQFFTYSQ